MFFLLFIADMNKVKVETTFSHKAKGETREEWTFRQNAMAQ